MKENQLKAKTLLLSAIAYLEEKVSKIEKKHRYDHKANLFCESLDVANEILAYDQTLINSAEFKYLVSLANKVNLVYGNEMLTVHMFASAWRGESLL